MAPNHRNGSGTGEAAAELEAPYFGVPWRLARWQPPAQGGVRLTAAEKYLWSGLRDLVARHGPALSHDRLADELGMTAKRLRGAIGRLERAGLLKVERSEDRHGSHLAGPRAERVNRYTPLAPGTDGEHCPSGIVNSAQREVFADRQQCPKGSVNSALRDARQCPKSSVNSAQKAPLLKQQNANNKGGAAGGADEAAGPLIAAGVDAGMACELAGLPGVTPETVRAAIAFADERRPRNPPGFIVDVLRRQSAELAGYVQAERRRCERQRQGRAEAEQLGELRRSVASIPRESWAAVTADVLAGLKDGRRKVVAGVLRLAGQHGGSRDVLPPDILAMVRDAWRARRVPPVEKKNARRFDTGGNVSNT